MYIQRSGYTWYIHGYPCISIMYIPRISMDIHGISFDVYPWYIRGISMDIPRFLNPDFSAGPCCGSHSMRTQVWVIKSVSFHAPPWQWCQGIRLPTKGSLLLSPRRRRLALRGAAGRLRCGAAGWVASTHRLLKSFVKISSLLQLKISGPIIFFR